MEGLTGGRSEFGSGHLEWVLPVYGTSWMKWEAECGTCGSGEEGGSMGW